MKNLAGTHLVVLSACETRKGGMTIEGMEVAGLGHFFLRSGAKSVMTSLWLVNDPATALLIRDFYTQLATGKVTKPNLPSSRTIAPPTVLKISILAAFVSTSKANSPTTLSPIPTTGHPSSPSATTSKAFTMKPPLDDKSNALVQHGWSLPK